MLSLAQEIERVLLEGPKRAKEIVERVSKATGKKESTVFYWLKKLQEAGRIEKVGESYGLRLLQEVQEEELSSLLTKLKSKNPFVAEEARKDLWCLCQTKMLGHHRELQKFLEEAIGGSHGEESRQWGLRVLLPIAEQAAAVRRKEVLRWLLGLKQLRDLALEHRSEDNLREGAVMVLHRILEGKEHFDFFFDLLGELLREEKTRKEYRPLLDRTWEFLLNKHFPERRMEIREKLYALLDSKEYVVVREAVAGFLGSLRRREFEALGAPKSGGEKGPPKEYL